ncbi:hypothetical protein [Xanthomonas cannabis]|uniref:hypothetical protein n=1 Tax=Xanthomonas cannabis TaxID=1885674 RepID=UPI0030B8C68C
MNAGSLNVVALRRLQGGHHTAPQYIKSGLPVFLASSKALSTLPSCHWMLAGACARAVVGGEGAAGDAGFSHAVSVARTAESVISARDRERRDSAMQRLCLKETIARVIRQPGTLRRMHRHCHFLRFLEGPAMRTAVTPRATLAESAFVVAD